jgi:glyoxylase-like metal-dependent hydrolase (beta-lactamase superfamily II)
MLNRITRSVTALVILSSLLALSSLIAGRALAQATPSFSAATLVKLGDNVKYGSYIVSKIGEGIYQINDPGDKATKSGGRGVDMYLICGKTKALMVDLGNNYIDGYAPDLIKPRPNAAAELRAVVFGLAGKLPLEVAMGHAHPDHDGMTMAFVNIPRKVILWMPEGEDLNAPKVQHGIDPSVYTTFPAGKVFDLGGGRIVKTFTVRGHTNASTVYLLEKDMVLFTSDAFGSGFGQNYRTLDALKNFAEDSQKLVDYFLNHYAAYERYSLRVYPGHSLQMPYGGMSGQGRTKIDIGYLDWRFIQNEAMAANGVFAGKWLVPGSGLEMMKDIPGSWGAGNGTVIMIDGIGSVIVPIDVAYKAAGLDPPKSEKAP